MHSYKKDSDELHTTHLYHHLLQVLMYFKLEKCTKIARKKMLFLINRMSNYYQKIFEELNRNHPKTNLKKRQYARRLQGGGRGGFRINRPCGQNFCTGPVISHTITNKIFSNYLFTSILYF